MSDYLARLRAEADRRLDSRDAAALQREIADHLTAATAAYEEVGEADPRSRAELALGAPGKIVRGVARALAPRGAARWGFGGTVAICLFLVFLDVGSGIGWLGSDAYPYRLYPWSPLIFALPLLWAGRRNLSRALLGAVAGAFVGYGLLVGAYVAFANPWVPEGRLAITSYQPEREIAQARETIRSHRSKRPIRFEDRAAIFDAERRIRDVRDAVAASPSERLEGIVALVSPIVLPMIAIWGVFWAFLGALSRRVRRPRPRRRA